MSAEDVMLRMIHRMHDAGIIDAAARDRMLAGWPAREAGDPHVALGVCQALLSVAIGHVEDMREDRS